MISSFLVLSVIGTFSAALFSKEIAFYRTAERTENRIRAFHLAESGVDQAIMQLRNNLSYGSQNYAALGSRGGYDIQIDTPDLTQPNLRRVTATGHVPTNVATAYGYSTRQIVAYVNFTPQTSSYALFSNSSIQMSGNTETDSYDSRNGAYYLQTPRQNGHVGTNTTSGSLVMISGNTRIKGNLMVGPGGDPSRVVVMSGNSRIEGTRRAASSRTSFDPVRVPSGLTSQGSLTAVGNSSLTFPGGTYWFSSIHVSGNGKVNFTGPATVYVTGGVSITGNGLVSAQNLPPNLTLKVCGESSGTQRRDQVMITGNGDFYGSIYAPASDVVFEANADLYGAVVGSTIQSSGNGEIHYDEALNSASGASSGSASSTTSVLAWTEV